MVADTAMDSMYLENLDEFINDEGKIVTYKWLSLTLGVHTNVAKQMLYHFVRSQRESDKGDCLSLTYIVSGVVAGDEDHPDVHRMVLVREANLAGVKSKMKDVISVHIYSVQKTKLQDMSVLYTANYDKVKENIMSINKYSGIECPEVKVRSSADLAKMQQENAYQAPPEPAKIESKYKPSQMKTSVKQESGSETEAKHTNGSNKTAGKSNQIASMFSRQTKKSDDKKDERKKPEKISKKGPSSAGSKTKGGISSFFNKEPVEKPQTSESVSSSTCKTSASKTKSSKSLPIKSDSATTSPVKADSVESSPSKKELQESVKEVQPESMDIDISPKKAKKQPKIQVKKARQQRGKNKKKEEKDDPIPKMKRKRIMQLSDSESSSEEEEEEEEAAPACPPSPPSPECVRVESDSDEEIPATPQPDSLDLLNRGRARKKIKVDKTYFGDDGFLVTDKVFEYKYVDESGDEDATLPKKEQDAPEKMETSPKIKRDISPKTKTSIVPQTKTKQSPQKKSAKATKKSQAAEAKKKQPNITNFFQRK